MSKPEAASDDSVVRAIRFEARLEALRIVDEARREAEAIKAQAVRLAEAEANEIKAEAAQQALMQIEEAKQASFGLQRRARKRLQTVQKAARKLESHAATVLKDAEAEREQTRLETRRTFAALWAAQTDVPKVADEFFSDAHQN